MTRNRDRKRSFYPVLITLLVLIVAAGGTWAAVSLFGGKSGENPPAASRPPASQQPDGGAGGGQASSDDQPPPSPVPETEDGQPVIDEPTAEELAVTYDLVIKGGRVINPETRLDQSGLNVAILDGTIALVTDKEVSAKEVIDATGLVVAPGFIDNLSYDPNPLGVWNKIADGVTANIAMHGGTSTPKSWYAYYEKNRPPVHFGASFFYTQARNQFKLSRYASATPEQTEKLVAQAEEALKNGALGISFSFEYVPGISSEEVLPLMHLAYKYNVPVYFHGRYSDMEEPGTNFDTLNEIIGYARASGASVHIDHINSTGGTFSMKESLKMIEEARAEGLDITACIYPYDFWGTYLNSARFDPGWQERFRITYKDLQIAGTNERLTAETFKKYQKEGKLAVAYAIPEQDVVDALKAPFVMIGSDAILEPGHNNHPRASGTFARTVGKYVREENVISLMEAIEKMSLMPAKRLEKQAPALKKKGRIAKGMDADIVIFNYDTIRDRSTVERPDLMSEGIEYVLVGGQIVLSPEGLNKKVKLGEPIRSEFVRVEGSQEMLEWEGRKVPLLMYRDAPYVDLEELKAHGYAFQWDKTTRTFTLKETPSAETADIPEPTTGELILERGYLLKWNHGQTELLSVGDRAYVPLSALQNMGWKAVQHASGYSLERA
jgi:N-acyl-D-aspartate/D-glutamate deacylase